MDEDKPEYGTVRVALDQGCVVLREAAGSIGRIGPNTPRTTIYRIRDETVTALGELASMLETCQVLLDDMR